MLIGLQILAGLFGATCFFVLLRRAFFASTPSIQTNLFGKADLLTGFLLSALFAWMAYGLFRHPPKGIAENDIVWSVISQLFAGSLVLCYLSLRQVSIIRFSGWDVAPIGRQIGKGVVIMLAVFPLVAVVANWGGGDSADEQEAVKFFRDGTSLQSQLLLAFMAVIIAPMVEELIFRGLLYRIFRCTFGKIAAMFFTAVLFACIHGSVPIILPLVLLSVALTAALEESGSLVVPVTMHATFNAINLLLVFLERKP